MSLWSLGSLGVGVVLVRVGVGVPGVSGIPGDGNIVGMGEGWCLWGPWGRGGGRDEVTPMGVGDEIPKKSVTHYVPPTSQPQLPQCTRFHRVFFIVVDICHERWKYDLETGALLI